MPRSPNRVKEKIRRFLPRQVRPHRIVGGTLKGLKIVTSWHDYPGAILGTTETPLLRWFEGQVGPGETWIDVGAHYGYTAMALSRLVGNEGRVFAFEPILATAGCVVRTREINGLHNLVVLPFALNSCANISIHSLPVVRGMADSTHPDGCTQQIFGMALDSLWPSLCAGRPNIDGVKIDVQGMELSVIHGMKSLLRRWNPRLVVELHRGVDRAEFLQLLRECGYSEKSSAIDEASCGDELKDDTSYSFQPMRP